MYCLPPQSRLYTAGAAGSMGDLARNQVCCGSSCGDRGSLPCNSAARIKRRALRTKQRGCTPKRWDHGLPARLGCQTNKVAPRRCGNGHAPHATMLLPMGTTAPTTNHARHGASRHGTRHHRWMAMLIVMGRERGDGRGERGKLGALALHLTSYPSLPSLPISLIICLSPNRASH